MPALNWELKTASPVDLTANGFAQVGDLLYILNQPAVGAAKLRSYNMVTDVWSSLADAWGLAVGFGHVPICALGNFLWVFSWSAATTRIIRYDIANNSWDSGFDETYVTGDAFIGSIGTDIYVAGGEQNAGTGHPLSKYDTIADSWTAGLSPLPVDASKDVRHAGAAAVLNGKLWAIGGRTYLAPAGTAGGTTRTDFYDPGTDTWTSGPTLHYGRYAMGAVSIPTDGSIWVGPGNDLAGGSAAAKATVEKITPPTDICLTTGQINTDTCPGFDIGGGFPPTITYPIREQGCVGFSESNGAFFVVGGISWIGADPDNAVQRFNALEPLGDAEGWGLLVR